MKLPDFLARWLGYIPREYHRSIWIGGMLLSGFCLTERLACAQFPATHFQPPERVSNYQRSEPQSLPISQVADPLETRVPSRTAEEIPSQSLGQSNRVVNRPAVVPAPIITVSQKIPERITANTLVPITLLVQNVGETEADRVSVCDTLPEGFEVVDSSLKSSLDGNKITWQLGRLRSGERVSITLRIQAKRNLMGQEVVNSVEVDYRVRLQDSARLSIRQPEPKIKIEIPPRSPLGKPVPVQIILTNPGTAPVSDLTLCCYLPEDLRHPGGNELQNQIGQLGAGETKKLTLNLTPNRVGDSQFRIQLNHLNSPIIERSVPVHIEAVQLKCRLQGPKEIILKQNGLYEIILTNQGGVPAKAVQVTAKLPDSVTFLRASDQGKYAQISHQILWQFGDLAPGETRSIFWSGTGETPSEGTLSLQVTLDQQPAQVFQYLIRTIQGVAPVRGMDMDR